MIKKNNRYIVTGGYGFLAKSLIEKLLAHECQVSVVCRNAYKAEQLFIQHQGKIEVIVGDLLSDDVYKKLEGRDLNFQGAAGNLSRRYAGAFHLAAMRDVTVCENQPSECIRANLLGSLRLLNFSLQTRLEFCVGASTFAADKPTGVYGASKFLMEKLFAEFSVKNPICHYSILRFGPLLYSPGSVLCKWKEALASKTKILLTSPEATRKFISPSAVIDNMLMSTESSGVKELNCKSVKLKDLLEGFVQKYGDSQTDYEITGLKEGEQLESGDTSEFFTVEEIKAMI